MNIDRFSTLLLLAASLVLASPAIAQDQEEDVTASIAPTPLILINGWTPYGHGYASPQVEKVSGIVHLKGAIATPNTDAYPFVLPAGFRPTRYVFVPVDLCGAQNGELVIAPTGAVQVIAENNFLYAQCFTSLDGVSFAASASGFTPLKLINGWVTSVGNVGKPGVKMINGIVHFEGAITTYGNNSNAFVLPKAFRPTNSVYISLDLCGATKGQLLIEPSGQAYVTAETSFSNAQCLTSLEGVWFARTGTSFTALSPINGWLNSVVTGPSAAANISGIVYLTGSVYTGGTNNIIFVLPANLRPTSTVSIPVDLRYGTKGRLVISPSGSVLVQAETLQQNAQNFTSLDGASFVR